MDKKKINFISEIASSHTGKVNDVVKLSNLHLKSKSNYLKYQIFKTENLYPKKEKIFYKFKKLEISFYNWEKIINRFKKKTKLILEPFDEESYIFCKKFKKYVSLKISTTEMDNFDLIEDAMKNFKKIFLNLSGFNEKEIDLILKNLQKKSSQNKIILMYGFQSYPSSLRKMRFNIFKKFYKNKFIYGYADHSIYGLSDELISSVFLALNFKCSYFEKHVCLDIRKKPNDYISSVHFTDFDKLINRVKLTEFVNLNLKVTNNFSIEERKYAEEMHKKAFTRYKLKKNSKIGIKDLIFLRSNKKGGLKRLEVYKKKLFLKKDINSNKFLKKSFIK